MRTRLVVAAAVSALVAVAIAVPGALGETQKCIGTPVAGTTVLDNVKVPRDMSCTLTGVRIKGNIKVGAGANLTATNVKVGGSIQGKETGQVNVVGPTSRVGGDVQIVEGDGVMLSQTRVKGNVKLIENGSIAVSGNRISGNLECKDNFTAVGAGNVVKGNAEDQCEAFAVLSP